MKIQLFALSFALALPHVAFAQAAKDAKDAPKAAAAAPAKENGNGPVATINGVPIPRSRAEAVIKQQTARGAQDNEQTRAQVREALINNELLLQEANRTGLSKKPEVQQQIDLTRQEVIANAMVADYIRVHPVTDGEIQKEYDRAKAQTGDREYKARHILVATEDEAKAVLADIKKAPSSTRSRRRNRSTRAPARAAATSIGTCRATSTRPSRTPW
jgi:parvulin-like peptidyl-prolyl isomerase